MVIDAMEAEISAYVPQLSLMVALDAIVWRKNSSIYKTHLFAYFSQTYSMNSKAIFKINKAKK